MMKKHKKRYDSLPSFVDLLLNVMMGVLLLYFLVFPYINPVITQKGNADLKADYIITIEWQENADIDLWSQDPQGGIAFFHRKSINLMHLDYDNRGNLYNSVTLKDGTVVKATNYSEGLTLRGIIPGEFTFNIHAYYIPSARLAGDKVTPFPVKFTVQRLNPKAEIVYQSVVMIDTLWAETTALRMTLDASGNPSNLNTDQKKLTR